METRDKKLMIVDDDPGIGEMLKALLEFSGYEVFVCDKPLETAQKIKQHQVNLVLLDLRLSGVDGTDICRMLKKDEGIQVPIVMMSALSNADETCKGAGADDFISKPFEMNDLLEKIEAVLARQER
ncbi:response regulator transcription factor [Salegentibacter sp. F14]